MSHIFTQARNAVIGRRARPITAALLLVALREIFTGACVALRYAGSGNHAGMSAVSYTHLTLPTIYSV